MEVLRVDGTTATFVPIAETATLALAEDAAELNAAEEGGETEFATKER